MCATPRAGNGVCISKACSQTGRVALVIRFSRAIGTLKTISQRGRRSLFRGRLESSVIDATWLANLQKGVSEGAGSCNIDWRTLALFRLPRAPYYPGCVLAEI
jgi:hypothetical protein